MNETHIIQVRDLIEQLQQQPQDAEVVCSREGDIMPVLEVKGGTSHPYRRQVAISIEGSSQVVELEETLSDLEQSIKDEREFIEKFDSVVLAGGTDSKLAAAVRKLHEDIPLTN